MKRTPILFLLVLPILLNAQKPIQFAVETRSGYEYNVFNASINKLILTEEGDTISALQSGFFQNLNAQASWKKKIKAHEFNARAKVAFDYFPILSEANLLRPDVSFGYAYRFSKKYSAFFKSKYLAYQTNRIPDETNVLSPPQSYQRLQSDMGLKFQLMKYNKSQFRATVFRKQYEADEDNNLWYDAYNFNFQTKQRFKKKGKPSHYLSLSLDFSNRNYVDEPVDFEGTEEEFDEEVRYRTWQYHTAKIDYSFAKTKALRWRMGLALQQRLDILDERFGYKQWSPFIKMEFEKDRLSLNLKVEGSFRYFTDLIAIKDTDYLLRHQYLRASLNLKYVLSEQCDFILQGNLRKRWRNMSEEATSFMPYTNGIISIGIKYRFFK